MQTTQNPSPQITKPSPSSLGALMRDLAAGLNQQMFFWGRDAIHPTGSFFTRTGFQKRPSEGLQGTSCYTLPWQDGVIELHGSHAGWFGKGGGFLFVRPLGRCLRWLHEKPPIPGKWIADDYQTSADEALHEVAVPFINWWLHQEQTVERLAGPTYRHDCYRLLKKLPKSRLWLPPQDAIRWVTGLRDSPSALPRARKFGSSGQG